MKFELQGYLDSNFGDDYMQKITVHNMPEDSFRVVDCCMFSPIVLEESNVRIKNSDEKQALPKLLVIGSGFMVNSAGALKCEIVWFLKSKHIADFCIGCNIEPFKSGFAEWLVIQKLKKFKYITCRDEKSLMWFERKCPKLKAVYIPDILFAMPDSWIPKTSDGKLGISLIHRNGDGADNAYYKAMANIADFWVSKTKKDVVLMAFNTGKENDVFSCECVKNLMQHGDKSKIVKHGSNREILNAFAACRKIIGARFHSAVLAMKMSIDFYPIIYREKMRNLISDMHYPVKGCDISDIAIEGIKDFLSCESVNFQLDKKYEIQAKNNFILLKNHIKEELK